MARGLRATGCLAAAVGSVCLVGSLAAGVVAVVLIVNCIGCAHDPEGVFFFRSIKTLLGVVAGVSYLEAAISAFMLLGICQRWELALQLWLVYHGGATAVVAVTVISLQTEAAIILYALLGAGASGALWAAVLWHRRRLLRARVLKHARGGLPLADAPVARPV